ncbi:hypothetical protein SCA6_005221 [Theobroma cacao]
MGYHQKPQYLSKTLEQDLLLPRVLFLRSPSVPSFFFSKSHLQAHFHLVDPLDSPEPTHSFLSRHAASLVVASSAGLDHIDLGECRRRGITVTSAGQVFTEDVADFAVGLLIDVLRRVSASDGCVRARLWAEKRPFPLGVKLGGNRVGIVGLGRIGSEVAKRLIDFGCSIAYCSRKEKPSVPYPYYSTVSELATNSDVLILCCSLTKETHHIINKGVMEALGKEGVIINIGRGALIDEKELVKFLEQGQIRGAGLDVYENEPHVSQELFAMENVVLAPHAAVYTLESFAALQELVVGNLKAFFSNKPLLTPAQLE